MEKTHKPKKVFVQGPINPQFIADSIARHQSKTAIGAHAIFLGQIRADTKGRQVRLQELNIRLTKKWPNKLFMRSVKPLFPNLSFHACTSTTVSDLSQPGEISLFVFVSSPHRRAAFEASEFIVEAIKANVPIFGKELVEGGEYIWKENS